MATLDEFARNMRKLGETVERRANLLKRLAAAAILQTVIVATPVGNPTIWSHPATKGYVGGRARANWLVSLSGPRLEIVGDVDAGGQKTISAGKNVIQNSVPLQAIHLVNNLPYIVPLNNGHSKQAPIGFIEASVSTGIKAIQGQKLTEE